MSEANQRFDDYIDWMVNSKKWFEKNPQYNIKDHHTHPLCVDAFGRRCLTSFEFRRARQQKAFPVRWWWPDQSIKELNLHMALKKYGEMVPAIYAKRLIIGEESPIRVWREVRGMRAKDLAAKIGVSGAFMSQVENGHRMFSLKRYKQTAAALGIDVVDLI